MSNAVAEKSVARVGSSGLDDLMLSPEERAAEAAEAAANRERELNAHPDAVQAAYDGAYQEALGEAQAQLDADPSRVGTLEQEAGPAVGEMPPREPEETRVPPETMAVTGPQGSGRKVPGKQPTEQFLTVKGMKIEVPEGAFAKGERLRFTGEMLLFGDNAEDKLDKATLTAVECVQTFKAVVIDFALDKD